MAKDDKSEVRPELKELVRKDYETHQKRKAELEADLAEVVKKLKAAEAYLINIGEIEVPTEEPKPEKTKRGRKPKPAIERPMFPESTTSQVEG